MRFVFLFSAIAAAGVAFAQTTTPVAPATVAQAPAARRSGARRSGGRRHGGRHGRCGLGVRPGAGAGGDLGRRDRRGGRVHQPSNASATPVTTTTHH